MCLFRRALVRVTRAGSICQDRASGSRKPDPAQLPAVGSLMSVKPHHSLQTIRYYYSVMRGCEGFPGVLHTNGQPHCARLDDVAARGGP